MAASAGGLQALSAVLSALPEDFPVPILIVQHLDPRQRSLLGEILSRRTPLAVRLAADGDAVRPGLVLIAPPDRHLLVNPDGTVTLSRAELVHFVRPSADLLFESAAGSCGPRCVAVVLSGTGSDGAAGVRAVKESGGTVIVQDDATAEFSGMPEAARRTGQVDLVLPLADIGPGLVALAGAR
ncbi:MAG TPA: chemotaxis protein CheB [Candidatus Dormibacteraeota bacterium]|nr:chemotaxis protein CheB [Candidatus Dormibacteraeota bacterium]